MSEQQKHVFISYRRKDPDKKFAYRLKADLEKAGHPVWIDTIGIEGGETWPKEIKQGIDDCYAYVVILSPDSLESTWVQNELHYTLNYYPERVRPILFRAVKQLPPELVRIQYIDFQNDYDTALTHLLKVIPEPAEGVAPELVPEKGWSRFLNMIRAHPVRSGGVLAMVVALGVLLATLVVPRLDQPEWATVTPTPTFADEGVIYAAGLAGQQCMDQMELKNTLEQVLEASPIPVETITLETPELPADGAFAAWACGSDVTVVFSDLAPYRITHLHEPEKITLQLESELVDDFLRLAVLYATGRYANAESQLSVLESYYTVNQNPEGRPDFYLLQGNLYMHQENWSDAKDAYTRGVENVSEDMLKATLLVNRALARYYDDESEEYRLDCKDSFADMQEATTLVAERADYHALWGRILVACGGEDDVEFLADKQRETAFEIDEDNPLVSLLTAEYLFKLRADTTKVQAIEIQNAACAALEQDSSLAEAHRVLGRTYLEAGMEAEADVQFNRYGELAVMQWQRDNARELLSEPIERAPLFKDTTGLGQCGS